MRWRTLWAYTRDICVTGTGLVIIWKQAFSLHPNGLLLGTGLALTVPSVAEHIRALLPSSGPPPSSPSSPPPGERRPPSSPPSSSPSSSPPP